MEAWKDIPGFEGLYQVSTCGNVRSLGRIAIYPKGGKRKFPPRMLKQKCDKGYMRVALTKNYKTKLYLVHRLVATAFIKNTNEKLTVNHIDGDKKNNKVENLEWCTMSENLKHAHRIGIKSSDVDYLAKINRKKVIQYDLNGNHLRTFNSIKEASEITKCHVSNITLCCQKKISRSRKYIFRYYEEAKIC